MHSSEQIKYMNYFLIISGILLFVKPFIIIDYLSTNNLFIIIMMIISAYGSYLFSEQKFLYNSILFPLIFLIMIFLLIDNNFEILNKRPLIILSWLTFPSIIIIKLWFDIRNKYYGIAAGGYFLWGLIIIYISENFFYKIMSFLSDIFFLFFPIFLIISGVIGLRKLSILPK